MINFENKVVWITGASSGLGEALAIEFAKKGAKLILSGRNVESLDNIQSRITDSKIVAFDVADPAILQEKVEEAKAIFGHIDVVVHNAGLAQNSFVQDIEQEVERHILQVDYLSPVELTRYLLPHFIERKTGYIIAVSGLLAYLNLPGRSTYAAAKAALNAYFGCLRAEVKSSGINISVIVPGSLATNLVNKALTKDGTRVGEKKKIGGYPLAKASREIGDALEKGKFQIYIGSGKERFMWKLWGLYPNFVIKNILKKMSNEKK